ncbi:MAG: hypothetical protein MJ252_26735 [archaeon]|nr:hypothetical protein [archaeon]
MLANKWKQKLKYQSKLHPHPLSKTGLTSAICDICGASFEGGCILYQCVGCSFELCENCKKNEEAGNPPRKPEAKEEPKPQPKEEPKPQPKDESTINSKNHPHPLKKANVADIICDVCKKEFNGKTTSFHCDFCDFDMCLECRTKEESNVKDTFKSSKHPHPLTKMKRTEIRCDSCGREFSSGIVYSCPDCDYDMCSYCKENERSSQTDTVTVKIHLHPLKRKVHEFLCDSCGKNCASEAAVAYNCQKCDFDICSQCKEEEQKGGVTFNCPKHPHPLSRILTDFYCDICDEASNGMKISYHCGKCDYDLCKNCYAKFK